jgi:WD40 repeat protein
MEQTSKRNRTLFLIGLLLALALLFASQNLTRQDPQTAGETVGPVVSLSPDYGQTATYVLSIPTNNITATYRASLPKFPTPIESSATPITPTTTSTLQPPQCTFPLAEITNAELMSEEYTFSEPLVVLTSPQGNQYNVVEWLPDNQQVLITEALRNVKIGNDPIQETISLYNPEANEVKVIASRHFTYAPPFWLPDLNAAVYPARYYIEIDKNKHLYQFTNQIWASYGNPDTAQILADDLPQLLLAVKPDGSETIYLSDKELFRRDKSLRKLPSVSIDPSKWDYAKARRNNNPVPYKMTWQPDTSLIFLYSAAGGTGEGGYTFILNADTGQVCELNLGGWADRARWSSNGRYLAIVRSAVYSGFGYSTDLVILDTITGNLYPIGVVSQDIGSEHYVEDFTWAPDNRHLLALGHGFQNANPGSVYHDLYLVDFMSGQSLHLFPEFKSFIAHGAPWNNFAWSPDGSKLLIRCTGDRTDRMCFMFVQRTGQ